MDVKAPLNGYERICRTRVDVGAVAESIDLLLAGRCDYEFRTTFAPELSAEDIVRIALRIHGARSYVLQQCRPIESEPSDAPAIAPRPDMYVRATAEMLHPFVQHCAVRGVPKRPRPSAPPAREPQADLVAAGAEG